MGERLKKQFNSPEWKAQQEQWKKMGEEFRKQFDSQEWKDTFKSQKWMFKDSTGGTPAPQDTVK